MTVVISLRYRHKIEPVGVSEDRNLRNGQNTRDDEVSLSV